MALNLKSSLAPLEVGQAPSGPSLSSVNIPKQQGYQGNGLATLGSVLGPIGTGVGALADSVLGYFSQKSANKANAKLAEYQNKWNLEQWKRENDYNKPLNQLRRYEEAGINPMLAMGNMDNGNAPALESAPMANQQAFTNFTGFQNLNQNLLAKEANEINRYNAETNRLSVEKDMSFKDKQMQNLDIINSNLKKQNEQLDANIQLLKAEKDYKVSMRNYQDSVNEVYRLFGKQTSEATLNEIKSRYNFNDSQMKLIKNQIEFNNQMLKFKLLESIRDSIETTNHSIVTLNTLKLGNSLARMQDSVTNLNTFNLNGIKPLEKQLMENTLRYDDKNKFMQFMNNLMNTAETSTLET